MQDKGLTLPRSLAWPMVAGGLLAVFATYWDEAWHTDVGRDSALAAPHVLLYGSVAAIGLGIAAWGIRALLATRSIRAVLAHPPLLAAGLGAATTLLAGGIDVAWHAAYGRDAVLWSPPHMLAIFGTVALVLGIAGGVAPQAVALRVAASVLLLANGAAVVFEYEADVPQFSEVLYLPVLLAVGLVVVVAIGRLVPRRGAVAAAVAGYAMLRLAVMAGLGALGLSTPDLPIAVLGLAAWELPQRSRVEKATAAMTAVAGLAWLASAAGLASPPASAVAVTALPVIVLFAVVLLRRLATRPAAVAGGAAVVVLGGALALVAPEPASAHDPGQGTDVAPVTLTADVSGNRITMAATAQEHCDDLSPRRLVARRAGEVVTADLLRTSDGCDFAGTLDVPATGRWFTYAELTHDGAPVEAWLPLIAGEHSRTTQAKTLYEPAGADNGVSPAQIVAGILTYGLGAAVVVVSLRAARRPVTMSP
ncbi:hypothetical protein [Promicromonospora soli]